MNQPELNHIQITINGTEISVPSGSTILEAAKMHDIIIPTLCYDEELTSYHACRICMVEVEGRGLAASCSTEAVPGMEVLTDTPRVVQARKTILELLLANHPDDCLVCDKSGSCKLQNYAYWYGVDAHRFKGKKKNRVLDTGSPFVMRDEGKCILCGKCASVCEQVAGKNVLHFAWRGFGTRVMPPLDTPLDETECIQCGNCIAVCPVGALSEKPLHGKGRSWEFEEVETVCPYCGIGCNINLNIRFGKVYGVTSCKESDVNGRFACVKGRFGQEFINDRARITSPYMRKNGELIPVSWAEAIHHVAGRFESIQRQYGGDSMGVVSSARITNEENFLASKFARTILGTNNIDHCARLCHAPTVVGLGKAFGSGATTNSLGEIEDTDFILAVGSNISETHPVAAFKARKALSRGALLAVVDPRRTELAEWAHLHAQIRPGTDIAFLNAVAKFILDNELADNKFIEERTENFKEYRQSLTDCTLDWAAAITGVPQDVVREIALQYARAATGMIMYTMGITQHAHGTDNVLAIANLAMITGKVGREKCGVYPMRGQNNVQGACDMGALPNVYSGYQKVADPAARAKFENAWGCRLPEKDGMTLGELLSAAGEGKIKSLYVIGENPVISDADSNEVMHSLRNLEFLVVQDIFMTETTELADVVLPAASFAEKEGTFTNTERRVQLLRQAIEPVGSCKPDWKIINQLASAMGYRWEYSSPKEIMSEIASLTPSYGGIDYPRLSKCGLQWPCPHKDHPGTRVLHRHSFARGKGRLHPVVFQPPTEQPDAEYPYILVTGRRLFHYHTGTMTRKVEGLNQLMPVECLQVNPANAEDLGLTDGSRVKLTSRRGEIEIEVVVTEAVPPGVVFTSFHFSEVAINKLTGGRWDPEAKIPELKRTAVRIEKTEDCLMSSKTAGRE